MLESIRRRQRWLTAILVVGIGFVFVVVFGNQNPGAPAATNSATSVVELDGMIVDANDFQRQKRTQVQRLQKQLGDQFDPKAADDFINQQVLRVLVERAILANSASEIGLQAPKAEIQKFLRDMYRNPDGSFDQEAVVSYIEREYGTQRIFMQTLEREILAQKMVQLLSAQVRLSSAELSSLARQQSESVSLAYVSLSTAPEPGDAEVEEEAIAQYRDAHDAELRNRYNDTIASYTTPDRIRARHILINVAHSADEASESSARDTAEEARQRVLDGAAFTDVASDLSEDSYTNKNGGDLGLVTRDELEAGIADAAFALDVGAVSEVLRGDRGFHIVLIEEKMPGGVQSYDEVATELATQGVRITASAAHARELSTELSDDVRGGSSLEDAARAKDLTLVRTGTIRRRPDGYVPDLGAAPELLAAAFSLDAGQSSSRVFEVGGRLILIQVIEHSVPSAAQLLVEAESMREVASQQKRNEFVGGWISEVETQLDAEGRLRVNADLVTGS